MGTRPDAGAIGGAGGGIAASGWELQPLPVNAGLSSSWSWFDMGGAVADRYVVGSERVILQSTDEGRTWSNIGDRTGLPDPRPNIYPYFSSISVGAISNVWIVAVMGPDDNLGRLGEHRLYRSIDRGQSWKTIQPGSARPTAVWTSREGVVVLGGEGDIWHSPDSGATWARVFVDSDWG